MRQFGRQKLTQNQLIVANLQQRVNFSNAIAPLFLLLQIRLQRFDQTPEVFDRQGFPDATAKLEPTAPTQRDPQPGNDGSGLAVQPHLVVWGTA
jgi:hypothetical protein